METPATLSQGALEAVGQDVISIVAFTGDGHLTPTGSGFVVCAQHDWAIILTAGHVAEAIERLWLRRTPFRSIDQAPPGYRGDVHSVLATRAITLDRLGNTAEVGVGGLGAVAFSRQS